MASDRDTLAELIEDYIDPPERKRDELVDAILAAGWRPPARVIESVRALDSLQTSGALAAAREHGYAITPAVIEDKHGNVYERDIDNPEQELVGRLPHAGWWKTGSECEDYDSSNIPLPVRVLREPKAGDR